MCVSMHAQMKDVVICRFAEGAKEPIIWESGTKIMVWSETMDSAQTNIILDFEMISWSCCIPQVQVQSRILGYEVGPAVVKQMPIFSYIYHVRID